MPSRSRAEDGYRLPRKAEFAEVRDAATLVVRPAGCGWAGRGFGRLNRSNPRDGVLASHDAAWLAGQQEIEQTLLAAGCRDCRNGHFSGIG